MTYLAVIDLGSNSTRMVVEELTASGHFIEHKRRKIDTRLAEGMAENNGALTDVAMQRVLDALAEFKSDYEQYGPDLDLTGIATAAVREATNAKEFLDRVYELTGVDVQVLTGDQEAYYDYLGAMTALDVEDAWLLDTGGASVELVGIDDAMASNFVSLPFGAVNLAEKFHLNGDHVTDEQVATAQHAIMTAYANLLWIDDSEQLPIIVLGGANRTLARLDQERRGLTVAKDFHGYTMDAADVLNTFAHLRQLPLAERAELLGTDGRRADIMISGLLPLVELVKITGAQEIIFSASGVREGLLQEYRLSKQA